MATPCQVCAHIARADIDRRLSFQVCNVAAMAREYGLNAKAVHRHRERHLPLFLPVFQARADTLTLTQLEGEAERLYAVTIDALARAEAGTLQRVEHWNEEAQEWEVTAGHVVSHTAVARMIREARSGLDQLTRLAADRPDERGRPSSAADRDLGEAIRRELARTVARSTRTPHDTEQRELEAELVNDGLEQDDDAATPLPSAANLPGDLVRAGSPAPSSPPFPLDSAAPPETPEGEHTFGTVQLTEDQLKTAAASIGLTEAAFLAGLRRQASPRVVHPEWAGSPAASKEERAYDGYADIEEKDNRIEDHSHHIRIID